MTRQDETTKVQIKEQVSVYKMLLEIDFIGLFFVYTTIITYLHTIQYEYIEKEQ